MNLDERLRESLARRADAVEPSAEGWSAITRRIERRQWRTRTAGMSLAAGLSFAAVALVVVMATVGPEAPDQNVAATGGSNPALGPTTSYAPASQGTPSTVPGQAPVAPGTNAGPTGPGSNQPGPDATTTGYIPAAIWPETLAELQRLQAGVAEGHQPWRADPQQVALAYLADRGLPTSGTGSPRSLGEPGALRYTSGGVGGWVLMGQLVGGTVHFIGEARSDRILRLYISHQGDRLAVDVTAATSGQVVVRTKRPGADWRPSTSKMVAAEESVTLDVDGPASTDLIVQVRHEGDDGKVGLSEHFLGASEVLGYTALDAGSIIDPGQIAQVQIGMTRAQAERLAGIAMTREGGTAACTGLAPVGRPEGVELLATAGSDRVDVIIVSAPGVRSGRGIGVGNSLAEVREAYPEAEDRVTDGQGRLVHSPADFASGYEIIFQVYDGEVTSIWTGEDGLSNTDELCA